MGKVHVVSEWTRERQERRARREQEFAAKIAATNAFRSEKFYGVIQTDDLRRSLLPAAKNCVLFLWADPPVLSDALKTLDGWGFGYRSMFIWVKDPPDPPEPDAPWWHGSGGHMSVLIGVKGKVPAPAPGTQFASVFQASDGRAVCTGMIAHHFPSTPCLDLWAEHSATSVQGQMPRG